MIFGLIMLVEGGAFVEEAAARVEVVVEVVEAMAEE